MNKIILASLLSVAALTGWFYSSSEAMEEKAEKHVHSHAHSHYSLKSIATRAVHAHMHQGSLRTEEVAKAPPIDLHGEVFEGHNEYNPHIHSHNHHAHSHHQGY